ISTRAPAMVLLPGMVAGLLLARHFNAPEVMLLAGAVTLGVLSLIANRLRSAAWVWLGSFILSTTLAFWAYGEIRLPEQPDARALTMPEREATLTLEIERVLNPINQFRKSSGIARVKSATPTSPVQRGALVYFRIKTPEAETLEIVRGQKLQVTGVLYPIIVEVGEDSFESYLKAIGIHYRFERTSELTVLKAPAAFDRFCMQMNERFQEYLRLGAPADTHLTKIYVAMLLGRKGELTDEQNDRFRMTGTMHFFAISGLHIGVIATVIAQCLMLIRVPRHLSPFIGLPLLYLYVEITGASPSAVRAFIMAAFFWASYAIVRQRSPIGALAASAVAVLIIVPEQLWSLGFQLSYIVVLSILLFGIPLYEALGQRYRPYKLLPEANWSSQQRTIAWLSDKLLLLFAISFSAWLASTPLSAGLFGFIAPGAILLNMLLVYLAALTITGGVIGLSFATVGLTALCGFLNHSAWVCLAAMDNLVRANITIPGSIIHCDQFPQSISYLTVVGFLSILIWLHQDRMRFKTRAVLIAPSFVILMVGLGYLMHAL
ncbi:MAG: ComEC family competence protein, partial [Opitutales bacterium]|nr:ComEC family competence protein [Opitutales bacterium]